MPETIPDLKAALRRQIQIELKELPASQRAADSHAACTLMQHQTDWRRAQILLCYAPMPGELDIWPLVVQALALGKTVCLPRYVPAQKRYWASQIRDVTRDLRPGLLGIREPAEHCPFVPLNQLDLVLTPGVAFDAHGRRLGRGKGFYDRLLTQVMGTKCGVAFDLQIKAELPIEAHDVNLDCILTPTRWLIAGPGTV